MSTSGCRNAALYLSASCLCSWEFLIPFFLFPTTRYAHLWPNVSLMLHTMSLDHSNSDAPGSLTKTPATSNCACLHAQVFQNECNFSQHRTFLQDSWIIFGQLWIRAEIFQSSIWKTALKAPTHSSDALHVELHMTRVVVTGHWKWQWFHSW